MSTRSKLALRFFTVPVLGTIALAVHHKLTTGHGTVPWIFMVVAFPLAAVGFWYNGDTERVLRAKARRDEREAQRRRETEEARQLPR